MAKILISSLGTGRKSDGGYQQARYKIDDEIYETSFVSDAIIKHYDIDKLFLVGTKKSIWDEAYMVFGGEDEEYHEMLYMEKEDENITQDMLSIFNESVSHQLGYKGSQAFIVDYGINNDQIWSNFEIFLSISDLINDGDELYLDITHSFRSLAMMSFVMTQFASAISDKKFEVKAMLYGMLEYQGESEERIAPIVDLSILLEIQEWIKAIDAIKKYSDFDPLVVILDKEGIEKNVKNTFVNLNNTIDMANMAAMQQFVGSAGKKIRAIGESDNKVIKLLAGEVIKLVDELDHEKMSDFQFALTKWFYSNKNYAMSYMALAEAVITKTCELKDYDATTEDGRKEAKAHIDYPYGQHYSATKRVNGALVTNEGSISDIRNNIAHQLDARSDNVGRDIDKLKFFIDTFEPYFQG